ncbi:MULTISPECIES: LamG-like jellyroll fold domain-containing protein [Nitrosopumilus]|uniref:LamG-like jellyroll fold domain-containing protein n=1 Tax=Nitrosopumilus TaxID=338191 RepID=UPI000368107C|nr:MULTISPECIES: LamG-like jellyroll fold domain-containing protein [Nitrosopumilus]
MKNRRALSTLVGAVFFIIAASSTVAYVSYSMNVIDDFSQAVIIKESVDGARNSESFEISDATITNNKFDLTVQNKGQLPIKLTKLWIENTTDSTWIPSKFDIDQSISPSNSVSGIGQTLPLSVVDTQAYKISLVTDRGNTETYFFNSVPDQNLSINLHAAPETVANGFSTTLFMTVTNDLPNDVTLLNIVPEMSPPSGSATAICDSSPTPASYPSLKKGESVIFKWSCVISGTAAESVTITGSIVNGYPGNDSSVTITIKDVLLALEAGTSLESLGFTVPSNTPDILTIHQESTNTPNGEYQLSSGTADATGFTVDLDQNNMAYITNNQTSTVTIPSGTWTSSLAYLNSHLDSTIDNSILSSGMIFHFEKQSFLSNGVTGAACDNEISATLGSGTSTPAWSDSSGVFSSGGFTFDGNNDYISVGIDTSCNDLDDGPNSTAGWFYVDGTGNDGRQVIIRAEESNPGSEFYEVVFDKSGTTGTLSFRFDSTEGKILDCNTSGVTTDEWHHFVGIRVDSETCTLYLDGSFVVTQQDTSNPNNSQLEIDTKWMIGANPDTQDGQITENFKGSIDSIMHWESYGLTSSEVLALNNTKYGDGAFLVDYTIERVDNSGGKTTLFSQTDIEMDFIDPLNDVTNFHSSGNLTGAMNQISLTDERILFTVDFVSGLGVDVRIDDDSLNGNPDTSFVQIPIPDDTFPGYFSYDINEDGGNYLVRVSNTGTIGAFFSMSGIRGVFDDVTSDIAYASLPQFVNGTSTEFEMSDTNDSIYLPPGKKFTIEFYAPTTHPSINGQYGTPITPGENYNFYVYLSGYDELGRTFFKTIDIGGTTVT